MHKLRAYLPAVVLFAGCLLVANMRTQVSAPLAAPLTDVLAGVTGYTITEQKVSDEERRVAGMSDYVARLYLRDSVVAFSTYVGYYDRQAQGKTIHSPRNCLPGAGWEIVQAGRSEVSIGGSTHNVNRYILKKGASRAVVYYWYQGRDRIVASEYAVKWNLLRDAALRGRTEEALVRIVIPVAPLDENDPSSVTRAFAGADALAREMAGRLIVDVEHSLPRDLHVAAAENVRLKNARHEGAAQSSQTRLSVVY